MIPPPRHRNPARPDRTACAPYNFIPLPDRVVTATDDAETLAHHDIYQAERHSGYFQVNLVTRSPLYVRCPLQRKQFDDQEAGKDVRDFERARQEHEEQRQRLGREPEIPPGQEPFRRLIKNTPAFFYTAAEGQPVIPGSSLRGMLRAIVEIAAFGKIQPVTERQLFFRSVDNSSLGLYYRSRMVGNVRGQSRVESGFLQRHGGSATIVPCAVLRVPRRMLQEQGIPVPQAHRKGSPPSEYLPDWRFQHKPIWVTLSTRNLEVSRISRTQQPGWQQGFLVMSGWAPRKAHEFIFLPPTPGQMPLQVPPELLERFEDDDQVTDFQQDAFPRNQPAKDARRKDGALEQRINGLEEPVFFLREQGKLTFFGRARMFRLPYAASPRDLVDARLRETDDIDYAEALFGYVKSLPRAGKPGDPAQACAGRVAVTDAVWDGNLSSGEDSIWLEHTPIVPKILATPKPTAFQHYLVQGTEVKDRLAHYGDPSTTLRGFKRYWHQGPRRGADLRPSKDYEDPEITPFSTQHTQLCPVREGVRFTFHVYFDNLSKAELGALCWALRPVGASDGPAEYCHGLGMGKPLGMGAVKLDSTLHVTDRTVRYQSLFAEDGWHTGTDHGVPLDGEAAQTYVREFETIILRSLGLPEDRRLAQHPRIAMLLRMMEWPGIPPWPPKAGSREGNTRYMLLSLEEFKTRPVLPDPSSFGGLPEPLLEIPEPAPSHPAQSQTRESPPADRRPQRTPTGTERESPVEPAPSSQLADQLKQRQRAGEQSRSDVERRTTSPQQIVHDAAPNKVIPATVLRVKEDSYEVTVRLHTKQREEVKYLWRFGTPLPKVEQEVRVKVARIESGRVRNVRYVEG